MEERFLRGDAVRPERERRELHPAASFLLRGLKRFVIFTTGAAVLAAGLGLVAGWLADGDLVRYLALGLYVGGGLLIAFALFTFSSQPRRWIGEWGEDLGTSAGGETGAFIAIGLALVGIGLLVEQFTL